MHPEARLAASEDAEEVIGLWQSFMTEDGATKEEIAEVNDRWVERLNGQILEAQIIVVELNSSIVGFTGFIDSTVENWIPEGIAYFSDIFVLPEERRKGAGQQLLGFLKDHTRGTYKESWLNTHKDNLRMQRLLERNGYEVNVGFSIEGLTDHLNYRRCV